MSYRLGAVLFQECVATWENGFVDKKCAGAANRLLKTVDNGEPRDWTHDVTPMCLRNGKLEIQGNNRGQGDWFRVPRILVCSASSRFSARRGRIHSNRGAASGGGLIAWIMNLSTRPSYRHLPATIAVAGDRGISSGQQGAAPIEHGAAPLRRLNRGAA